MSNLATLLQNLATDPKLLAVYRTEPDQIHDQYDLSAIERESVMGLVKAASELKDFQEQRLYIDDDQGGIIYMLYTKGGGKPEEEKALHGVLDRTRSEITAVGTGFATHYEGDKAGAEYPVNVEVKVSMRKEFDHFPADTKGE